MTFYLHPQELSADSLLGGRVPINWIVVDDTTGGRELPNLEITPRQMIAGRLIDRGGSLSTRLSL